MLINFRVENYLSFYERREFSMIAGRTRAHKEHLHQEGDLTLLKGSYIYGANAAGKSNFIKSLDFMKKSITRELRTVTTLGKNYRLKKESINKKTEFEVEILMDKKIYAYGFSLMLETREVLEEWLYEVGKEKDKLIFERGKEKNDNLFVEKLEEEDEKKVYVYLDDLERDQLLLEVLGKKRWKGKKYGFLNVLKWFRKHLTIIFPETNYLISRYKGETKELAQCLNNFDTGIAKVTFKKRDFKELPFEPELKSRIQEILLKSRKNTVDKERVGISAKINDDYYRVSQKENEIEIKELLFTHGNKEETQLKLSEESDGTKRLVELIPLLEKVKSEAHIIFIDEIERSLHPILAEKFLKLIYQNMRKTKSQLIITTHESRLLDLTKIRRDEVWFAERNEETGTNLYSLEEYQTRFDKKIDKAYLLGRYGGIPNIKGLDEIETLGDA